MLFSSFVISTTNCGLLSDIILSGNLYSFYILFLNNLTNPSAKVSSVMATKCAIFDNLSHTTRIVSFSVTSSSLVIKSIIKYVHDFSRILFAINFSVSTSILFFILWYRLQPSIYIPTCYSTLGLEHFSFSFLDNEEVHDCSNMTSYMKWGHKPRI